MPTAVREDLARLFPAWWTHFGASGASRPLYRVLCVTPEEKALAKRIKPRTVRAQYIDVAPAKPASEEDLVAGS